MGNRFRNRLVHVFTVQRMHNLIFVGPSVEKINCARFILAPDLIIREFEGVVGIPRAEKLRLAQLRKKLQKKS